MRTSSHTLTAAAAILLAPASLAAQSGPDVARAWRETHEPVLIRDFVELLSYPNVAEDSVNVRRTAAYILDRLLDAGVAAELLEVGGAPPVVYGTLTVPGATRTLGLYAHYDGHPVNPDEWTHAPWEATLYTRAMEASGTAIALPRDGERVDPESRLYARSAGDDKTPIASAAMSTAL